MKRSLCYTVLAALLLFATIQGFAADTLKIHLTYKHNLNDAGRTTGYYTLKQQFYTPDNVLFREIHYDEKTHQIARYTFYFYKSGKLFTEEYYNSKDSLLYILKHNYDPTGLETGLETLVPGKNGLEMTGKILFKYNAQQQKLQQKKYFGKRAGIITKYKYDAAGRLSMVTSQFKPAAANNLKTEVKAFTYNNDNKTATISYSGRYNSGKAFQYKEEYNYNDKGLLSSVITAGDETGKPYKKSYKYLPSGTISLYEEYSHENKLTLLLQYDYKKHFMDKGNQVSHYENL